MVVCTVSMGGALETPCRKLRSGAMCFNRLTRGRAVGMDAGESGMKPPVKPGAADVASERLPKAYRLEIMLVPVDDAQAV